MYSMYSIGFNSPPIEQALYNTLQEAIVEQGWDAQILNRTYLDS